jgi:hypothetical protein
MPSSVPHQHRANVAGPVGSLDDAPRGRGRILKYFGSHVLPVVQHEALRGAQGPGQQLGQVPVAARERAGGAFLNNHKRFWQLILLRKTGRMVTGRP